MVIHRSASDVQKNTAQRSPFPNPAAQRPAGKPTERFAAWYMSRDDEFIYSEALSACRASRSRLAKYLPPDDNLLLQGTVGNGASGGFDEVAVRRFLEGKRDDAEKSLARSKIKWLSDATNSFASVATRLSDLLGPLVPQSPEYTVPFGCLMVIFKMLVAKQDKREKAMTVFDRLLQLLPSLELWKVALPSLAIKRQLAQTYIDILDLIVCVTEWCAIGRLSKLIDVMALRPKYDFDAGLQQVEESHKALMARVKEAIAAVVVDSHEFLKNQSKMINYIADNSESLASHMIWLSRTVEELQVSQLKTEYAQAMTWCGGLIDALLPDAQSEWEETRMWAGREFHLAPKDHWEVNGILDILQDWKKLASPSVLAIFGPSKGRDTWVTEFSLDLIQACKLDSGLVASAMCDRPDGQPLTPMIVVKYLICQLLEQKPQLILGAPKVFNLRAFRRIQGFDHACYIFQSIVAAVSAPLTVVIDRLDCCEADPSDSNKAQDLVAFLSELTTAHAPHLDVIITSADEPPEDHSLPAHLAISTCMIASSIRLPQRRPPQPACRLVRFDIHTIPDDEKICSRKAVGLEQLYGMRHIFDGNFNGIFWKTKLVPKTPRERMICRFYKIRVVRGELQGGNAFPDFRPR